jgi:cytohesin
VGAGACLAPTVLFGVVAYSCYAVKQDIDESMDHAFDDASIDLGDIFDVEWDPSPVWPGSCETSSAPFVEAAWRGDDVAVRQMIDRGTLVDAQDPEDGRTALYCAAFAGNETTAGLLLDAGASPDIANEAGDTPLLWAADGGHLGIVDRLLAAGADPSAATHDGHTPLFRAVSRGHVEVADRLLAAGVEVDATVSVTDGVIVHAANPLDIGAGFLSAGGADCATALESSTTVVGLSPADPVEEAPSQVDRTCAVLIRYPGAGNGVTALHSAALRGSPDLVALLLDSGAAIEATTAGGFTPLQAAALRGDPATVQVLLDRGADPTPATVVAPPHELARELGHEEAAQILEAAASAQ